MTLKRSGRGRVVKAWEGYPMEIEREPYFGIGLSHLPQGNGGNVVRVPFEKLAYNKKYRLVFSEIVSVPREKRGGTKK